MAKILEFKPRKKELELPAEMGDPGDDIEGYISAVINNYSLTVANRHWILENMLMDIDDQLDSYRNELEEAEKKLDALVKSAETEIAVAYKEFNAHVGGMTQAVKKLTMSSRRPGAPETANMAEAQTTDHQTTPQ